MVTIHTQTHTSKKIKLYILISGYTISVKVRSILGFGILYLYT